MRLKKLEVSGFKSFAHKTTLEFPVTISAIVGPNGSGKSNIAEAMRFVLGEQSMKSMRGKRGEDLIFNGSKTAGRLLLLGALALTIKLVLQAGSTYPSLSQLAFGFRPIVIGYLHLVLLGVISLFILGWMISLSVIPLNRFSIGGIVLFTIGVILNEMFLMLQGVCGMENISISGINEILFCTALILFAGAALLLRSQLAAIDWKTTKY